MNFFRWDNDVWANSSMESTNYHIFIWAYQFYFEMLRSYYSLKITPPIRPVTLELRCHIAKKVTEKIKFRWCLPLRGTNFNTPSYADILCQMWISTRKVDFNIRLSWFFFYAEGNRKGSYYIILILYKLGLLHGEGVMGRKLQCQPIVTCILLI